MAQGTFHFPRGFLWGTATASHQVEGNNTNNNWWAFENEPGNILEGHKSGLADDWWGGRWREDFDRAAQAGQNAHRLSLEWSRIQPEQDRWDEDSLDRYREMVRGLVERDMTPMITLHHFSDPNWLVEMGGWEDEAVAGRFQVYVDKVVEALREYANLWVTINEPNVLASMAFIIGAFPPGKQEPRMAFKVMANLVRAHAAAYQTIHKLQPEARVGISFQYRPLTPANSWSPFDRLAAGVQSGFFNDFFPRALQSGVLHFPLWRQRLPEAKGTQDFLGINYYTSQKVSFSLGFATQAFGRRYFPEGAQLSDSGDIANQPEGLYAALKLGTKFKLPMIITENGLDDAEDHLRPRYLIEHLHQAWRAVNFNFPLKGYFHWTLVDNFEWDRGWTQRFGLWELDVETQARRKRSSADLYAEICRQNGISSQMVERFAPELMAALFPD